MNIPGIYWLSLSMVLAGCSLKNGPSYYDYPSDNSQLRTALNAEAKQLGCKPVYYDGGFISIRSTISDSGRQCVMHDYLQGRKIDLLNGKDRGNPGKGGILRFYNAEHVDLDLRNHLISGRPYENMLGIVVDSLFESGNRRRKGVFTNLDLRVTNGRVETPGEESMAVSMAPNRYRWWVPFPEREKMNLEDMPSATGKELWNASKSTYEGYEETPWDYRPVTHYTVDNLQITSGGRGVVFSGAENALRNSTVEVESQVAMVSYGPKVLIENNTFIVHMGKDYYTAPATSAIVKLRDADEAVIRNNRFIVKGWNGKSPAAINLINSKNVTIEGNTVEGAEILVRTDADSSVRETGNGLR